MKELIQAAANEGKIALADIPGGDDFDYISEWLEYASDNEAYEVAIELGLADDDRGDIHEIEAAKARERARNAGIQGA